MPTTGADDTVSAGAVGQQRFRHSRFRLSAATEPLLGLYYLEITRREIVWPVDLRIAPDLGAIGVSGENPVATTLYFDARSDQALQKQADLQLVESDYFASTSGALNQIYTSFTDDGQGR